MTLLTLRAWRKAMDAVVGGALPRFRLHIRDVGAKVEAQVSFPIGAKMKRLALVAFLVSATAALADQLPGTAGQMPSMPMDHTSHMAMDMPSAQMPHEGGQAAFAAIQEIVSILAADPKTDWSKVNMEALRQHLIDMDNVTLRAKVTTEDVAGGVRFLATGEGDTVGSIRRMVTAHAQTMNGVGGWNYTAEEIPQGAALTLAVANPQEISKAKALGFIGVLALGSHHQMHHLMIASGQNPHL